MARNDKSKNFVRIFKHSYNLGLVKKLKCFQLAGADLNTGNLSGQTPLHAATECGQIKVVKFLVEQKEVDRSRKDVYGRTAVNIADILHFDDIKLLLK